jgi:GT2 family glycosyltransferase
VLDADNALHPLALTQSLAIAEPGSASLAVVHPLVEVLQTGGAAGRADGLISLVSWQQQHLQWGNVVDAMALVRRDAWAAVGGYVHIAGGWEDFDFWCTLIDAGYHGVLCPQILATYHRHCSSMLQQHTNRQMRRLSRLLQSRHPWLRLPLAAADA